MIRFFTPAHSRASGVLRTAKIVITTLAMGIRTAVIATCISYWTTGGTKQTFTIKLNFSAYRSFAGYNRQLRVVGGTLVWCFLHTNQVEWRIFLAKVHQECNQEQRRNLVPFHLQRKNYMIVITSLTESIMHLVCSPPPIPQFTIHNHCFQFLLGIQLSLEKSKTMVMQNLGGNQSALWSRWKWRVIYCGGETTSSPVLPP